MNRYRPDFEAPGPGVLVVKNEVRLLEQEFIDSSDQIDEDDDFSTYQYYDSEKILGKQFFPNTADFPFLRQDNDC